jgi:hypothetical protein
VRFVNDVVDAEVIEKLAENGVLCFALQVLIMLIL